MSLVIKRKFEADPFENFVTKYPKVDEGESDLTEQKIEHLSKILSSSELVPQEVLSLKSKALTHEGQVVLPEYLKKVQQIFCGLGDDEWYAQIIDGVYIEHGEKVFDEGLHAGDKEPGFYDSLKNAFTYAKEHLCEPVTLSFYLTLNKIACAHFKKDLSISSASASQTGKFRDPNTSTEYSMHKTRFLKMYAKNPMVHCAMVKKEIHFIRYEDFLTREEIDKQLSDDQYHDIFNERVQSKVDDLRKFIDTIGKNYLDGGCFPEVLVEPDTAGTIDFKYIYGINFDLLVTDLFDEFKEKTALLNDMLQKKELTQEQIQENKLWLIAALFQLLELIHPFPDGQGRTDLLLLSKLLTENGFTPAILFDPYVSTGVPLDRWVAYLKEGMTRWQQFKDNPTVWPTS